MTERAALLSASTTDSSAIRAAEAKALDLKPEPFPQPGCAAGTCTGCTSLHGTVIDRGRTAEARKVDRAPSLLDYKKGSELSDAEAAHVCMHECGAKCCTHVAWGVDKPKSATDFDEMRWAVMHGNIAFFKEDGDWYMLVSSPCRHLQPSGACGVYETRPQICRDYKVGECEHPDGLEWDEFIDTEDALDTYRAKVEAKRAKRRESRGKNGKPTSKKKKEKNKDKAEKVTVAAKSGDKPKSGKKKKADTQVEPKNGKLEKSGKKKAKPDTSDTSNGSVNKSKGKSAKVRYSAATAGIHVPKPYSGN